MKADLIFNYFPGLSSEQREQFELLEELYKDWNQKINVVSRKDIDELYLRHVLHSLSIAKFQYFMPNTTVLDVGTGGGFPGIPLAIFFPEVQFTLVDSIGKKIKVVEEVVEGLQLKNVTPINSRVEDISTAPASSSGRLDATTAQFDFIVSRAVAAMPTFTHWVKGKIKKESVHERRNGILYLKGGDLTEELKDYKMARIYELTDYFKEDFFDTKKLVYLPLKFKG